VASFILENRLVRVNEGLDATDLAEVPRKTTSQFRLCGFRTFSGTAFFHIHILDQRPVRPPGPPKKWKVQPGMDLVEHRFATVGVRLDTQPGRLAGLKLDLNSLSRNDVESTFHSL
jgi:hypothetical protein